MSALDDIRAVLAVTKRHVGDAPTIARAEVACVWLGELVRAAKHIHIDHDGTLPFIAGIAALHRVLDRVDGVQS